MERFFLVVVLCFTWTHQAFSDHHDKWNYVTDGPNGPKNWGGECQTGQKQTPIDIKSADTTWKNFTALDLENYDSTPSVNFTASNNGHTFGMSFPEDVYYVRGANLTGNYTTVQIHLHWGSTNMKGSEHFVDGKQYAAELHFVSYNTKYENISVAVSKPDGLAVLGVFLNVAGGNNTNYDFLKEAKNVIYKGTSKAGIAAFKFDGMLPADRTKFFRYSGSLTTPGCDESVTWTVFKDAVDISQYQIDLLRMLNDSDGQQMVDNFRPIQDLNNRVVLSSFNASTPSTPSSPSSPSTPEQSTPTAAPTADATAVSMTAALFLLMLVAAFFMH